MPEFHVPSRRDRMYDRGSDTDPEGQERLSELLRQIGPRTADATGPRPGIGPGTEHEYGTSAAHEEAWVHGMLPEAQEALRNSTETEVSKIVGLDWRSLGHLCQLW